MRLEDGDETLTEIECPYCDGTGRNEQANAECGFCDNGTHTIGQ